MNALLYLFVAVTGALTSVEAGSNAKLTALFGGPWWGAILFSFISFGLLAAGALAGPFPSAQVGQVPCCGWLGGSMLVAPGRMGSGSFTGLTVTAAPVASIAPDHYGLVGFKVHPAGVGRLVGGALMVAGVICMAVF